MIQPEHTSLQALSEASISVQIRAGHFASCPDMALRLNAVFGEGHADMFHALPISRKQVICAVLSGPITIQNRPAVLRSNLCLCAKRYLLTLRFGAYDALLHRFLSDISPSCLKLAQYDPLWVLASQMTINLNSYARDGTLDAAGIIALLPDTLEELDTNLARCPLPVPTEPASPC